MALWWSRKKPAELLLAGVSNVNDDYPNVRYKLAWLTGLQDRQIATCVHDLASSNSFWSIAGQQSGWRKLALTVGIGLATIKVLIATLYSRAPRVYIVYPSLPLASCLGLIPARWRPQLVLDGFISLYDTAVNDRGMLAESGWRAKLLFAVERFSFARAETVTLQITIQIFPRKHTMGKQCYSLVVNTRI